MKTVCIYHRMDLDGWMSAAIVKHWFEYKDPNVWIRKKDWDRERGINHIIDFIGYHYGDPIPDLSEYKKVIMCDISFPKEAMLELASKLIWIDHHVSSIIEVDSFYTKHKIFPEIAHGLRDTNFAACELTWKYFFPEYPMPEIVRLLGRYDCFGHKGTDEEQKVLEFQYGARQCISNYEEAYRELEFSLRTEDNAFNTWYAIWNKGKTIYQYLCTEAKQVYKNGFKIKLEVDTSNITGVSSSDKFILICINRERFNPINFGIDYHKDGYDGVACFWYANGMWNFSLYNDNGEVDCSLIAKQYGGGGHFSASGFICNDETFLNIIKQ